jgi:hypothetical protein
MSWWRSCQDVVIQGVSKMWQEMCHCLHAAELTRQPIMTSVLLGPAACIPWGHSSGFPGSKTSKSTLLKLFGLGLLPLASASACTRTCCCCVLLGRCASGATLRPAALSTIGLPKLAASLGLVLHTCCPVRLRCMVAGVAMGIDTLGWLPAFATSALPQQLMRVAASE